MITQSRTNGTTWSTKATFASLVLAAVVAAIVMTTKPAQAGAIFTVNQTGDSADENLADGLCDINSLVSGQQCTLRAAIQEANDTPGADAINFNLVGSGALKITPSSALPAITEQVTIDGYSQPGASPNTLAKGTNAVLKIELNGNLTGSFSDGLVIQAPNSVVRGLAINRFSGDGIFVDGASGSRIEGNFIGTAADGTFGAGNSNGVNIGFGSNNTVGGTTPDKRNLISENVDGVQIFGGSSAGNKVLGNLIGTDKSGTQNDRNSGNGVSISGASNNSVGDGSAAGANTIAFNLQDGVDITTIGVDRNNANGNSVLRNSIFSNFEQGIDLDNDGVTSNDLGDADAGPNTLQNKPAITTAKTVGGVTTIKGKLNSEPNKTFKVQFFSNPAATDEGKKFIGQKSVSTDASGNVSFTFQPKSKVAVGQVVTATATTNLSQNTSEFSTGRSVAAS